MRSQIPLGRIFGIKIGLHLSWFLIAWLIVFSLSGQFHAKHPQWGNGEILVLSIATALLFFVSLLLHELAHSLVATSRGLPVREITLFALGGVSQIERDAATAKTEFWMALVGPLTSAVIGVVCRVGAALLTGIAPEPITEMLLWLGYINFALAAFNMIPGYPLDGGRVLRAIIWWKTGDVDRSTRLAARTGQAAGGLFIVFGIVQYFSGAGFGGLWMAFIGWFLLQSAGESYRATGMKHSLEGVRVAEVMARDCPTVDSHQNLRDFVDQVLLRTGQRCFVVLQNGVVAGLVTPHEIKEVSQNRWPYTTLDDIMKPLDEMHTVTPDTSLTSALEVMSKEDLNQLPVLSGGHLEGVLSRADILSFLQLKSELQA